VGGADGPGICNVWQVLQVRRNWRQRLPDRLRRSPRATATAELLAIRGKKVHMITSSLFIGAELGPTQDLYLTRQRLLQKGVTFTPTSR